MEDSLGGLRRLLVLLTLVALVASACGGGEGESGDEDATDEPIVIGAAIGLSGFLEAYDVPPFEALQIRVDEINAEGGLLGRQIEIVTADTRSDPDEGRRAALELVEEDLDLMIVTCDFDFGSPAALVAQEQGIISFSLCAGSPRFGPQGIGDLAFTIGTPAQTYGAVMAEFSARELGFSRAYILLDTVVLYQEESVEGFKEFFTELGGTVVGEDTFQNDDASIAGQITRLREVADQVDFLYLASFQPGVTSAIRQIRAAGIDLPIVGSDSLDGDYWLEAVPDLSDAYYGTAASIFGDDPDQAVNDFLSSYEEATGSTPETSFILFGYALMQAWEEAVKNAGTLEAEAVKEALESLSAFPTVVGDTTFTSEYHITTLRPQRIMTIEDGEPSFVQIMGPSREPSLD